VTEKVSTTQADRPAGREFYLDSLQTVTGRLTITLLQHTSHCNHKK